MAWARANQVEKRTLQCRVALAGLQVELSAIDDPRPIVVTDAPDFGASVWATDPDYRPAAEELAKKWGFSLPDRQLERDLGNNHSLVPLQQCPNIAQWLDQHHIAHGDGRARETVKRTYAGNSVSEEYDEIIVSTSIPALSSDQKRALVATGYRSAPLGGQGSYLEFEIALDGSVRLTRRYESWVS